MQRLTVPPGDFSRVERVASTVQKALAGPVGELARNHGAGLVTITAVDLAPDLRSGVAYLSVYGDTGSQSAFLDVLRSHAGDLQAGLGRTLRMRRTPVLKFRLDESLERGDRISRLLGGHDADDA